MVKQTKPFDSPIPLSSLFIAGGGRRSHEFQEEWRVDHSSLTEYKGGGVCGQLTANKGR